MVHAACAASGAGGGSKTIVFGLFQRAGRVYTEIVPNCSKPTLKGIIRGKIDPAAMVNTDGWRGYDGLVDVGYDRHYRVLHSRDEYVQGAAHINGIESFWSFAKGRLHQFAGVPKHTFLLHLKECEFRFNHRYENLYKLLLKEFRQRPLSAHLLPKPLHFCPSIPPIFMAIEVRLVYSIYHWVKQNYPSFRYRTRFGSTSPNRLRLASS